MAAINVLARIDDPDISRFTPTHEVEKILLGRFQRRLESRGRNTEATAHGRTSSKPRRTKDVGAGIASDSQSPVHMDGTGETQRLKSENKRSS